MLKVQEVIPTLNKAVLDKQLNQEVLSAEDRAAAPDAMVRVAAASFGFSSSLDMGVGGRCVMDLRPGQKTIQLQGHVSVGTATAK
jgi:hypothetical protein